MKKKSKQLEKLELSIKDIVEGIGNAFSAVWGGIKDLFYQIYTSEYGIWIIGAMIVNGKDYYPK